MLGVCASPLANNCAPLALARVGINEGFSLANGASLGGDFRAEQFTMSLERQRFLWLIWVHLASQPPPCHFTLGSCSSPSRSVRSNETDAPAATEAATLSDGRSTAGGLNPTKNAKILDEGNGPLVMIQWV